MAQPMDGSLAREASHPDKRREARPQLDRSAARRHAAVVERARLLRERSATRVQAAFRSYKSRVLDAPAASSEVRH